MKNEYLTAQQIMNFQSRYAADIRASGVAAAKQQASGPDYPEVSAEEARRDSTIPTEADNLRSTVDIESCRNEQKNMTQK